MKKHEIKNSEGILRYTIEITDNNIFLQFVGMEKNNFLVCFLEKQSIDDFLTANFPQKEHEHIYCLIDETLQTS